VQFKRIAQIQAELDATGKPRPDQSGDVRSDQGPFIAPIRSQQHGQVRRKTKASRLGG